MSRWWVDRQMMNFKHKGKKYSVRWIPVSFAEECPLVLVPHLHKLEIMIYYEHSYYVSTEIFKNQYECAEIPVGRAYYHKLCKNRRFAIKEIERYEMEQLL